MPTDGVVVFDGVCNLCARSVHFILEHEQAPALKFASVQSAAGARLMREFGLDPAAATTFLLIVEGQAFVRSEAAIRLAHYLKGGWRLLAWLAVLPRPIRDWGYDLVARHRYRWFGRRDVCLLPTPDLRARFLED